MTETDQSWTRKYYETWDEAFHGLAPAVRQQSVRVAAYTQVLYVQACAGRFGKDTKEGAERMNGKFADLAYKCGMYHQIGKALVPPEYQVWSDSFTDEERAVYRKYTTDGRQLAAALQERTGPDTLTRRKDFRGERPTRNVTWLMIRESCEQHLERWDGTGVPKHLSGNTISPIAQIVGLARELDRLVCERKSETPFADAYRILVEQSGMAWDPALIDALKVARDKCRRIYHKYINYSKTLPKTIPLVERRKDRPMGLSYRPMVSDAEGKVMAYEAEPWFCGEGDEPQTLQEVEPMLQRRQLVESVSWYFLYEATDTILRMENCQLPLEGILLPMMPSFYRLNSQMDRFDQLFEDQQIPRNKLLLSLPTQELLDAGEFTLERIKNYLKEGICLVLDGFDPTKLPAERVRALGFTYVRLDPALHMKTATANAITRLRNEGIRVIGAGADTHDTLQWMEACGVLCMSGTVTGVAMDDDELILDALEQER